MPTAHGIGLFADSVPNVYDANYLSSEEPAGVARALAAETDEVMESFHHRRVVLEQGDDATAAALVEHGFSCSTHLVFAHMRGPDRRVDTSMVHEVEFERLDPGAHRGDRGRAVGRRRDRRSAEPTPSA